VIGSSLRGADMSSVAETPNRVLFTEREAVKAMFERYNDFSY